MCRWFCGVGVVPRLRSLFGFRSRSGLAVRGGRSFAGAVRVGRRLVCCGVFGRRCAGIVLCGVRAGAASWCLPLLSLVRVFRALVFVGWLVVLCACGFVRSVRSVVGPLCLGVRSSDLSLLLWSSPSFGGRQRAWRYAVPAALVPAGCLLFLLLLMLLLLMLIWLKVIIAVTGRADASNV